MLVLNSDVYHLFLLPALEYPGGRCHLLEANGAVEVFVEDGGEVGVRGRGSAVVVGGSHRRFCFRCRVVLKEECTCTNVDSLKHPERNIYNDVGYFRM